mgnify:CR=1 FL=1
MLCPVCQKSVDPQFTPFCSRLCKNTDLLRWFKEDYRIPTQDSGEDGKEDDEEEDYENK